MKRRANLLKVSGIALAAVTIIGLTACGGSKTAETTTAAETKVETTAAETTKAEETTKQKETAPPATETTTEAETAYSEDTADVNSDCIEIARALMEQWNDLNRVTSCAISVDYDTTWEENGYIYHPVTDEKFQSIGDINNLLVYTVTDALANKLFPYLANPSSADVQMFLYLQDDVTDVPGLYIIEGGRGFVGVDTSNDIEITNVTGDSFDATIAVDDFGQPAYETFHIVNEDGWKIDSAEIHS